MPKESGRFDLPIALGILAASEQIQLSRLDGFEFAGELSLAGDLRPVRGALALGLAMDRHEAPRALVLPQESAQEAALVKRMVVYGVRHLLDVVAAAQANEAPMQDGLVRSRAEAQDTSITRLDLRDVKGQAVAKRALEIAATGGHSLLMMGPPGTGKSMLAQRLVDLMPALSPQEALESAAVQSLHGGFDSSAWGRRVMRRPHATASAVALVGGGSPPRPGEISLAHHGVLFLDELPEFPRASLESLREPMESGCITISRAARSARFPASFQLVAAMNPCPCGHLGSPLKACRCAPETVSRYQGRISGPLLDRIDMQVEVPAVAPHTLAAQADGESSDVVAERVRHARDVAQSRQSCANALLSSAQIDRHCALDAAASAFLQNAAARLGWSARSYHRVLRIARTVADLGGSEAIEVGHLAEAIQYRRVIAAA